MKDPETVKRIELLARAETALAFAKHALDEAARNIGLVLPAESPILKALADARLSIAKADVLTTNTLSRFSR